MRLARHEWFWWLSIAALLAIVLLLGPRCSAREYTYADAVVRIVSTAGGEQSHTSGVQYRATDGNTYILTCRHGITGPTTATPWQQGRAAAVMMDDYGTAADIAVLRIASTGEQPVFRRSTTLPKAGERIVYVGWPSNSRTPVYRSGRVTSMNAFGANGQRYMETDIAVGDGGSGGAYLNASGQIVGVQWGALPGGSMGTPLALAVVKTQFT